MMIDIVINVCGLIIKVMYVLQVVGVRFYG